MSRGIFISIEGPDGSGKSTQIENIKEFFHDKNMDIIFTREPGGTPIGERIRGIILDRKCSEMDPMTEAMLYAAARAQHVAQVIRPALEKGKIVICDRFVDSSIAYQGYGRKLGEAVASINHFAVKECMPKVVVCAILVLWEHGNQKTDTSICYSIILFSYASIERNC